jgi:sialate O-acetylesterase
MTATKDAESEIAAADWPDIRFIDVPKVVAEQPIDSFESNGWQACKPENIGPFSAVGYFFARDLHKELNVPIGLVGCNWGGTMMEAWTSREALESSKTFAPLVEADDKLGDSPEAVEQKKKLGPHRPAALFNGMISTVVPYGIRGVIWYQGESNAARHDQYAELSKLMIADWRNRWDQGEFPFLLVQLAAFEPGGDAWPFLREAQAETLEAPNTGMAVAIDIGDQKDIHPRNKQDVGARLALAARHVAYGEDLVYSGPMYREMKAADGAVRLSFDHVGGGLKAGGETLSGFQIAGADGKFVPAEAKIDGAQVVVSSKEVADPTAVRYNWAAFPDGNLQNAEGLPAVPFRTDRK